MTYKRQFTAESKPLHTRIGQVLKRGYEIELMQPTSIAATTANLAGRRITPLPVFKRA